MKAAGVEVEPYWPGLFAKALEGINAKDLITNVGSGVGAAPAAGITLFPALLTHFYFTSICQQFSFLVSILIKGFFILQIKNKVCLVEI